MSVAIWAPGSLAGVGEALYFGSVLCFMPSAIDLAKRALVSLLRTLAAAYGRCVCVCMCPRARVRVCLCACAHAHKFGHRSDVGRPAKTVGKPMGKPGANLGKPVPFWGKPAQGRPEEGENPSQKMGRAAPCNTGQVPLL